MDSKASTAVEAEKRITGNGCAAGFRLHRIYGYVFKTGPSPFLF
jgi:hypothetical protein